MTDQATDDRTAAAGDEGGYETIRVDRTDAGVVTVTLDRQAKRNAINGTMWGELGRAFTEVERSTTDRVLVLTGAGGAFCSGQDLSDGGSGGSGGAPAVPIHPLDSMRAVNAVALTLHRIAKPIIAKVRGVAVGAGCNLALHADLIVAAEDARFSEIFAKRGLSLDFGGSWLLPRRVGLPKAMELALLADFVSGTEAEAIGLINRAVPEAELDALVDDWATRLASGPPLALAQSKEMLKNSHRMSMDQALDEEGRAQAINLTGADAIEARAAFLEKREPKFQGR